MCGLTRIVVLIHNVHWRHPHQRSDLGVSEHLAIGDTGIQPLCNGEELIKELE